MVVMLAHEGPMLSLPHAVPVASGWLASTASRACCAQRQPHDAGSTSDRTEVEGSRQALCYY